MHFPAAIALFNLFGLLWASMAGAAPLQLESRQIGGIQCNVNRLQIVSDLTGAKATAKTLTAALASDQASSDLMSTVTQGISDAQAGIGKIAQALFTGQQAPAEDRDQVASGLGAAIDAAGSLDTTDDATSQDVTKLQQQLAKAATAGKGVVANCK
ncbi:hypothetical protein NLI96_g1710 [Meripilus lineatus]|uniref:Cell wall protein n=1 Tax=Meripilus lineatus TaxID=2056292 RepID=A0AAD5VEB8_9APHY|nr:hypothetical protein NLI96_g1710 [Physisporinus lineatus]